MDDGDGPATKRPASGMRGRAASRREKAAKPAAASAGDASASAADADPANGGGGDDAHEEGSPAPWKVELETIMSGTNPTLVEALEPHDQKMKAMIAQADRVRQLQVVNINALFECEKKQADDESKAQLEFFKARLIDTIEEKQRKAAQQAGRRSGADAKSDKLEAGDKRKRGEGGAAERATVLPASYMLKPDELTADLEEINTNVDHYSTRGAAQPSANDDRGATSTDAWFDRSRQLLHANGYQMERGITVFVYLQGQRVDDTWTLTAMNAVEVTLRDSEGTKLKVTLAQLRNGRYVFRPAPL